MGRMLLTSSLCRVLRRYSISTTSGSGMGTTTEDLPLRLEIYRLGRWCALSLTVQYCSSTMPLYTHTITHSHTLLITCTCCYDQIKGTQDKDFSYSFSDSLSLCKSHFSETHLSLFWSSHNLSLGGTLRRIPMPMTGYR